MKEGKAKVITLSEWMKGAEKRKETSLKVCPNAGKRYVGKRLYRSRLKEAVLNNLYGEKGRP